MGPPAFPNSYKNTCLICPYLFQFNAKCVSYGAKVLKLAGIISGVVTDIFTSSDLTEFRGRSGAFEDPNDPQSRLGHFRSNVANLLEATPDEACKWLRADQTLRNRFMIVATQVMDDPMAGGTCEQGTETSTSKGAVVEGV